MKTVQLVTNGTARAFVGRGKFRRSALWVSVNGGEPQIMTRPVYDRHLREMAEPKTGYVPQPEIKRGDVVAGSLNGSCFVGTVTSLARRVGTVTTRQGETIQISERLKIEVFSFEKWDAMLAAMPEYERPALIL